MSCLYSIQLLPGNSLCVNSVCIKLTKSRKVYFVHFWTAVFDMQQRSGDFFVAVSQVTTKLSAHEDTANILKMMLIFVN